MSPPARTRLIDDLLGGTAATLVAFPSALAFGLLVYSGLGSELAQQGALYGMIGALTLGIVAASLGGRPGNVSAPCAPAAAVLAALVGDLLTGSGRTPEQALAILGLVGLGAAGVQLLVGVLGGGRLIKFIPYPVIAGYLAAVGLLIVLSQLPKLLALPPDTGLASGLLDPSAWRYEALLVGAVTVAGMLLAPKLVSWLPAPILGLALGIATYGVLCLIEPSLRTLEGNPFVIGSLGEHASISLSGVLERFRSLGSLSRSDLGAALIPTLTLAVLLSIDTLKTSVLVDSLTHSRHDSDKELRAQGIANLTASLLGGMPGAATTGPTLVNVSSGGRTRRSGIVAGVMALLAFVALSKLIAWVPLAALAGILIVIGARMLDRRILDLLKRRRTTLDFLVVAAVVVTGLSVGLTIAAGVGLVLAIVIFLRQQIQSDVVRRWLPGCAISSKNRRLPDQRAHLKQEGERIVLFQLQGSLFFGTTDQLFSQLEPHIAAGRLVILDLSRVGFLDFTAGRMLHQIEEQLREAGGQLILASLDAELSPYLKHFRVIGGDDGCPVFPDADDALGWAEDQLLDRAGLLAHVSAPPLDLGEVRLFKELTPEQLEAVNEYVGKESYEPGQRIFSCGDLGDTLYLVRRGSVQIVLPLEGEGTKHLATFGRGSVFGDMAFLSPGPRSAHAQAVAPTQVFSLSRTDALELTHAHPDIGNGVFANLGVALAERLRDTDQELRLLAES